MGAKRQSWNETGTASVIVLRPMLTFAGTRGVDIEAILAAIGISLSALDDYDRRIPEASRARVWVEAAMRVGDPDFGLQVVEHARIGAYDALDYSCYFSDTLGEALDKIIRFHRVLSDAWAITPQIDTRSVRLRRTERTPPQESEAFFALLILRFRELAGVDFAPTEVRFYHSAPSDTTHHERLFRAPLRFGCSSAELVFHAACLKLPIRTANPGVDNVIDRYLTELLERLPKNDSFVERVRSVVARTLRGGRPTLLGTASALHASARTVQRRLEEHGTSHNELVESVRRDLAERLVAEGRLSITEIAFLLGFTDLSGFRRFYKRWTGVAPSRGRPTGSGPTP